jgi:hypothetical protein
VPRYARECTALHGTARQKLVAHSESPDYNTTNYQPTPNNPLSLPPTEGEWEEEHGLEIIAREARDREIAEKFQEELEEHGPEIMAREARDRVMVVLEEAILQLKQALAAKEARDNLRSNNIQGDSFSPPIGPYGYDVGMPVVNAGSGYQMSIQ